MKKQQDRAPSERLPIVCKILYALAAVCAVLYAVFTKNAAFSDWFNLSVSRWGRRLLAFLTNWMPFSFAELILLFFPILLILLIWRAVRVYCRTRRSALSFLGRILSAVCAVAILFVLCFAPGYYGSTLDRKLGLDRAKVSKGELYQTAELLAKQINPLAKNLLMDAAGSSVMPYSLGELNEKLLAAYETFTDGKDFPDHFQSRIKPVALSTGMSYMHITGIYTFFTGEANVNTAFPDYTVPFTAAHELAHQRGVAREDEANFVAFLVCLSSDDAYIRYSGLMNVFEYVGSALFSTDASLYRSVFGSLQENARSEEYAYTLFFEKYQENVAATVSEATNNAYLQSQGAKEGTKSYSMVVDLAVAYYRAQFRESDPS